MVSRPMYGKMVSLYLNLCIQMYLNICVDLRCINSVYKRMSYKLIYNLNIYVSNYKLFLK